MAEKYDHKAVEKKWQDKWESEGAFRAEEDSSKPKQYILDMFPYPSGDGLHVGHVESYTATDIYSRYKRMRGFNVLHPTGWDAFGLPAENYAIKTGVPPQETTDKAIANFKRQMKSLGFSYDWSREVGTHNPDYYRWTQWLFTKFFEKGLVYKKKALVNWDPVDQTVLANEQVLPDGTAERSGAKVEKRDLEQWFFKITDYADELNDSLEALDWPEPTKINQRNWIGRSEGAELEFAIAGTDKKIKVFTTRPDTLFGATYVVLAPEHPLVDELARDASNKEELLSYIKSAKNKSDIERSAEGKEKTGVELKGIKAINPATKEEVPVFIADYVLGHYGTGAIMAVPAHDERDYQFAQKFSLPVRQVVESVSVQTTGSAAFKENESVQDSWGIIALVKHWSEDKYMALRWPAIGWGTLLTGGIDEGLSAEQTVLKEIHEETGYKNAEIVKNLGLIHSKYYHAAKKANRFGHAPTFYVELRNDQRDEVSAEEASKHELLWLTKEELKKFLTAESHLKALDLFESGVYAGPGILTNSGEFNGLSSEEAKKKITDAAGGVMKKTYRLRDWLISRQRYWGAPIPIVYDPSGVPHAVPAQHLPWMLPTDVEFKPTGTSPLGQSKELSERTERIFGKGWKPEVDTMDTFACSSWYFFRFTDPRNDKEFASKEQMQKWLPVDLYMGGAEHTVLHLLYARFFTKVLRDMGYLSFGEPFLKLRHQGIILAEDSRKMSKRWGNVINPDDMAARFGADALRMYEMFMGPLEAMKPWATKNITGLERFLERVWRLSELFSSGDLPAGKAGMNGSPTPAENNVAQPLETLLHQTIKKVGEDIEQLKLNTAVSALMILLNELEKGAPKAAYETFIKLLAPFAPHMAHELAEKHSINLAQWPAYDESKLASATAAIAVQVDGKVRTTIELPAGTTEEEALAAARMNATVKRWLGEMEVKKAVYVPGKIISFSTK